ncbi:hypothetical protein H7F30_12980 [Dermacoccus sp. PAMC28757]|uniref:hypothetical protein n=1 Tax=Dermacoccus sp. PAMC28757 TaxID=2762331 RepID=UPI00164E7773|nr:hypothetical protein [Dermacoccus sp. PAMC28757]QNK52486.1 hypothetical protein H7F30_12980 [Dermacoccus sp. PAMC28757]
MALGLEVLTEADYTAMLERLDVLGWHLLADDDGLPWVCMGSAPDGRMGVGLHCLDPIASHTDLEVLLEAEGTLLTEAGLRAA